MTLINLEFKARNNRIISMLLVVVLIITSSGWIGEKEATAATTWSTVTSNTTNPIYKVAYGNGMWVASAESGKVITSSDGSTWTERTVDSGYTDTFLNITYGGGKWVVVGNTGHVYTSTDGITWTSRTINTGSSVINLSAVVYANSTYVIVANSGNIYYSSDAVTWTNVKPATDDFLGVAYGNSLFVAAGSNGVLYTSPDGATWTSRGPIASSNSLYSVRYLNGSFYATSNGLIATSTNGTSWSTQSISAASGAPLYDISYSTSKYVISGGSVSSSGVILVSSNGTSWTTETSNTDQDLYGVATNDNLFMIVGGNGVIRSQTISSSTDATLSNLTINQGTLSPTFASGTTSYSASVAYGITSINVTPTVNQANATVKVNGTTTTSGNAQAVSLSVGTNSIPVVVTAQDGSTTKTYTINVTRAAASTDATLSNLAINQGTLTPTFASGTTSYTANVAYTVTSVNVTPTVNQANATVKVNGTTTTSGSAQAVSLSVGSNSIPVVVTAQDGSTTKTYTLTVTRAAASTDATLSNLAISQGTLSPTFASGTTSYTASVANTVTSLTVTPTTSSANSTVTVNGTTVTSGSASGSIALAVGSNTISTVVTAQDGSTTKTYTLTVTRAAASSTDATLSNLAINQGTLSPTFASGTTSYSASVAYTVTSINVTPTVNQANATVTVNGTTTTSGSAQSIPLAVGSNSISVVVTAQDGSTTKTYTLTVTRAAASTDANLSGLAISQGTLSPTFASGTTSYTASVANSVTSLTVTPTNSNSNATVTVNGTTVTSGSASGSIALAVGNNTITTRVTAQDGSTTKDYTITVTRAAATSTNANLSSLSISSGTLAPTFASATTNYSANVSNATTSITLTPTVADSTATVTVNGTTVTSGNASGSIPLAVGSNTINTTVTAQDGTTTKSYVVTVTRAASSNANLSNLIISQGTLTPTFASGIINYTANVSNVTTSITVTPTVADNNATVTVNGTANNSGSASSAIPLVVGSNTISIVVTAQNSATQTYTITVTREAPSSNANLGNLAISQGTLSPAFDATVTAYNASVDYSTGSIDITPTVGDSNATVTVNGNAVTSGNASTVALNTGSNTVTIQVTAQNGSTKTYTITVTRLQNPNLSNLTISAGVLTPTFDTYQTLYNATVNYSSSTIQVTPTAIGTPQGITVAGTNATSGSPTTVPLAVGSNTILIVTTMTDGATQTYTIKVTRNDISDQDAVSAAYDALLIGYATGDSNSSVTQNLTLPLNGANGTIINWASSNQSVIQNDGTVTRPSYPNSDVTVTLNALIQKNAALSVKTFTVVVKALAITDEQAVAEDLAALNIKYAAGDNSTAVTQNVGLDQTGSNNTVITWESSNPQRVSSTGTVTRSTYSEGDQTVRLTAKVTRGSATNTKTFDLTIKAKSASSAADLKGLTVNGLVFSPTFDPQVNNYSLSVSNSTNTVTVTASVYDPDATMTINGKPLADAGTSDPIALSVGENVVTVVVTAQNGVTQSYTITIKRDKKSDSSSGSGSSGNSDNTGGTTPGTTEPTTPGTTPVSDFEIIVNGRQIEQIATGVLQQQNGQSVFTATIDTDKLGNLLANEGTAPQVIVPVKASADKVNTVLTGEAVQILAGAQATLRIETVLGNYTLPSAQLRIQQLAGELGNNANSAQLQVNVTINRSTDAVTTAFNNRASRDGFTVAMTPVDFNITAAYNGQVSAVNEFTTYVKRELPVPADYDPNRITTAVVVDEQGNIHHVPTAVAQQGNQYYAVVNSLTNSNYGLIWNPKELPDVANHWSKSAVNDMASRLVVNGVDSTHFNPNNNVTRAEFAAILVRALGLSDTGTSSAFTDVSSSDWYMGAVAVANEYNLIDGYEDGTFRPNKTISRQEAFVILNRAMTIVKLQQTTGSSALSSYTDQNKVASWAQTATQAALSSGVVQGNGKLLNPTGQMSRAETATVMQRLLKLAKLI